MAKVTYNIEGNNLQFTGISLGVRGEYSLDIDDKTGVVSMMYPAIDEEKETGRLLISLPGLSTNRDDKVLTLTNSQLPRVINALKVVNEDLKEKEF